jgi:hypothetical protein
MAYFEILAAASLAGTKTNLVTAAVVLAVLVLRGVVIHLFSNSDRR